MWVTAFCATCRIAVVYNGRPDDHIGTNVTATRELHVSWGHELVSGAEWRRRRQAWGREFAAEAPWAGPPGAQAGTVIRIDHR